MVWFILWFVSGIVISIYGWTLEDDITSKDLPFLLLGGLVGPFMLILLLKILKIKTIFNSEFIWFKKIKKK